MNNVQPSEIGDTGFYFLSQTGRGSIYRLLSSQGRYLVSGGDLLVGSNREDALVRQMEVLGRDRLRAEIQEAIAA